MNLSDNYKDDYNYSYCDKNNNLLKRRGRSKNFFSSKQGENIKQLKRKRSVVRVECCKKKQKIKQLNNNEEVNVVVGQCKGITVTPSATSTIVLNTEKECNIVHQIPGKDTAKIEYTSMENTTTTSNCPGRG